MRNRGAMGKSKKGVNKMILDSFATEMIHTFSVYPKKTGLDGGSPAQGFEATATLEDIEAAYFEGSAAESFVSQRFKTIITGVIITETGVSIPGGAKIILDDDSEHYVIHADNPLNLDEVFVVALRAEP